MFKRNCPVNRKKSVHQTLNCLKKESKNQNRVLHPSHLIGGLILKESMQQPVQKKQAGFHPAPLGAGFPTRRANLVLKKQGFRHSHLFPVLLKPAS